MRFKIDFKLLGEAPFSIPVNYQSEFSTWIHKMLHFQSTGFTNWLAEKKFLNNFGEYNLYTFSDVILAPHKVQNDKITLDDNNAGIFLSFYAPADIEPFIHSVFKDQEFKIGDSRSKIAVKIENITSMVPPVFNAAKKMEFSCLSPMLIAQPGQSSDTFLSPDQKDFDKIFFKSLMFKYANLVKYMPSNTGGGLSNLNDLQFKLLGKPKTKIIKIRIDTPHQKSVKGYLFNFEVKAPEELLKIGYNAGFGELNNLGFGCCEIKS
jgi:CRISPR-associated endoribonuclease Cas6